MWFRQVNREQWRAFLATFLGWVLDAFDFTILTFVLIDIQQSFTVDRALAGALGTVTLFTRLIGGVLAGAAADRYGRKIPLMLSILWYSLFAGLGALASSYTMLFVLRALFGIGMGGEWAAGMPLALEHWPARLRGIASGLLAGGWYWGFILAAMAFQFVYPAFAGRPGLGWRVMLGLGVLPALLVLWIRTTVRESPVWLDSQRRLRDGDGAAPPSSLTLIFRRDLRWTTARTSILIGAFMFCYYSISYWYPTFLREEGLPPLRYLIALNVGGIMGTALWGRLSETLLGRRGAAAVAALCGVVCVPIYLLVNSANLLWLGALLMGIGGAGIWGVIPSYITEQFPTAARGAGPGFAYHAGALLGSGTPLLIGWLQDQSMPLPTAMAICIVVSGLLVSAVVWLGPETRGRSLTSEALGS